MNQEIILESLARALESWIRHASADQLWQVHRAGGLGASIHVDADIVRVRVTLGEATLRIVAGSAPRAVQCAVGHRQDGWAIASHRGVSR